MDAANTQRVNDYQLLVNLCMCYACIMVIDESKTVVEYISAEQREMVAAAIRRLGIADVAKRLGLSNEAVLRLAGNFGSQAGTEALAVQRLERLK